MLGPYCHDLGPIRGYYIASISITVLGAIQYHALQFHEKCIKTTLTKKIKIKISIQI